VEIGRSVFLIVACFFISLSNSVGDPLHFGADPDLYLWPMDPDLAADPEPSPGPTPFFSDFEDAKKFFFFL
jgi:hypothetical protein